MRTDLLPAALTVVVLAASPAPGAARTAAERGVPAEDGKVLELAAPTPAWYTPRLHRRVVAAGRRGKTVPLPDAVALPQSALAVSGIRPGSWMLAPSWCTMNFVYGSRSDYFIGTAGHCAPTGRQVTIVAAPGVLMNIGRTVKSVSRGVGNDFALVDVRASMERHVAPSMAVVGGPTGARSPEFGDVVIHVGHGVGIGTGGTPRAGIVTYVDGTAYGWDGAASPGDSGSAVRAVGGRAVGNLTHIVVGTKYAPAVVAGTSVARMNRIAGRPLVTARVVSDPLR